MYKKWETLPFCHFIKNEKLLVTNQIFEKFEDISHKLYEILLHSDKCEIVYTLFERCKQMGIGHSVSNDYVLKKEKK